MDALDEVRALLADSARCRTQAREFTRKAIELQARALDEVPPGTYLLFDSGAPHQPVFRIQRTASGWREVPEGDGAARVFDDEPTADWVAEQWVSGNLAIAPDQGPR